MRAGGTEEGKEAGAVDEELPAATFAKPKPSTANSSGRYDGAIAVLSARLSPSAPGFACQKCPECAGPTEAPAKRVCFSSSVNSPQQTTRSYSHRCRRRHCLSPRRRYDGLALGSVGARSVALALFSRALRHGDARARQPHRTPPPAEAAPRAVLNDRQGLPGDGGAVDLWETASGVPSG